MELDTVGDRLSNQIYKKANLQTGCYRQCLFLLTIKHVLAPLETHVSGATFAIGRSCTDWPPV